MFLVIEHLWLNIVCGFQIRISMTTDYKSAETEILQGEHCGYRELAIPNSQCKIGKRRLFL